MTDNALKLKKYINKYNNCMCQDKKILYKQKIKKYHQLGGAEESRLDLLPEDIYNRFGSYLGESINKEKDIENIFHET